MLKNKILKTLPVRTKIGLIDKETEKYEMKTFDAIMGLLDRKYGEIEN